MNTHLQPVLIGVDDSPAADAAVRAGVSEARRLGATIGLVHVVPDRYPLAPVDAKVSENLSFAGAALLKQVAADVAELAPELDVETQMRRGGIASQLAEAAEAATVLYVGRDNRPAVERALQGNAGAGAVARSPCPVVSVPEDWDPEPARGDVVVALKTLAGSAELLADAFAEAAARGDRVIVLHSWKLPSVYDDIIVSRVGPDEPTRRTAVAIEILLREWRISYPEVVVELRIVHDQPAHAMVAASRSADLLVLVRRSSGGEAGALGGTGRAVLRSAECPVRVVPAGRAPLR